ncbi:LysR substrate-binding domain-containing protein [Wukongibacter baidiensis]|uniref:LysR substrate-binding domain-containing protein n=1 Tax=Wukongibacter baidiensis TaxID=1723361 RepID=UPI003D7FB22B
MEFSHLKAFYQVAISGTFSKAAEELFISQPALSRQIAALEKELDLQLFTRQSRQVVLTDAGRRFLVYVEKIINLNNRAKREMAELKNLTTGQLTLGASTTIANYLLPSILSLYQRKNPNIDIYLNVGNSCEIEEMVYEGKVDIGLIAGTVNVNGLYQEQFFEDELYLVVPQNHNFIETTNITSTQLNQETFLCREKGSDTQQLLDDLLANFDISPRKLTLGDTEAIKRGVINNMGVAFLSKYTFEYEFQLGLLVPIKEISMKRSFSISYPKSTRLSPAALAFWSLIKKYEILNHI